MQLRRKTGDEQNDAAGRSENDERRNIQHFRSLIIIIFPFVFIPNAHGAHMSSWLTWLMSCHTIPFSTIHDDTQLLYDVYFII